MQVPCAGVQHHIFGPVSPVSLRVGVGVVSGQPLECGETCQVLHCGQSQASVGILVLTDQASFLGAVSSSF